MRSSKWFSMLTTVASVVALSVGSVATFAQSDKVTLRYALWDSNQQPAYQACADAFTKANPNITISIEQAGWSQYWDGLTTSLVSGYSAICDRRQG